MDEEFVINLKVEDARYPLRIKRSEEEVYRRAAKEIDYKLGQYKSYFTVGDSYTLESKDYMAMTAIQAVAEKAEHEIRAENFEKKVKALINDLDSYLKKAVR